MSAKGFSTPVNIEQRVAKILMEQRITSTDQRILWRALLGTDAIEEEEVILIERVFYGLRHGLLQIIE